MGESNLLLHRMEKGIVLLTLNRPEKRNALNIPLLQAFCSQFETLQKESSVRVLILNGAGPAFCSGLDLKEIAEVQHEKESAALITAALTLLYRAPFVTIAAVHGAAIAGGAGLMAACDIVIAASDLQCGFPEVRRGLVPAQISAILQRQLSWRNLRELLLVGEILEAEQSKAMGLINKIVPPSELISEALQWAQKIVQGAPVAIRETKQLLEQLYPADWEHDLTLSTPYHHRARQSSEAKEGAQAFFEKRPPKWTQE